MCKFFYFIQFLQFKIFLVTTINCNMKAIKKKTEKLDYRKTDWMYAQHLKEEAWHAAFFAYISKYIFLYTCSKGI